MSGFDQSVPRERDRKLMTIKAHYLGMRRTKVGEPYKKKEQAKTLITKE